MKEARADGMCVRQAAGRRIGNCVEGHRRYGCDRMVMLGFMLRHYTYEHLFVGMLAWSDFMSCMVGSLAGM